ncbi:MAG TPA: hypothetical protein VMR75_04060 [Candidatus Saccharimonadales bacterium]|nr:hypothetical protein [Candidatus Saccharimonadales bacterium]
MSYGNEDDWTVATDFSKTQVWLGDGNSVQGCVFNVKDEGQFFGGMQAYFTEGEFIVTRGNAHTARELAEFLQADPHFAAVISDYLQMGLKPSSYSARLPV